MIKNLFKYYFSFFTLISLNVFSQELDYNIEYITTQEGLSSNYVTKVISDQFNFKWFDKVDAYKIIDINCIKYIYSF